MKVTLIQIGNSRGIRLPKLLIEQAGLGDEVELQVQDGAIIISRTDKARTGWAEAAARLSESGEDALIDPPASTRFDEDDLTAFDTPTSSSPQ